MRNLRKLICVLLTLTLVSLWPMQCLGQKNTEILVKDDSIEPQKEDTLHLQSPSYILMEASTGKIILEKNADERMTPASITKIMTLLLIFEAIEQKQISLEDEVTTSAYAKSMGGSQVFLEEGEIQTVDTLIKCIAVASGNDASVAMAEYIAGTEEAFVNKMNEKAKEIGLENTHFKDCCGLTNADEHYTSAHDVARMAQVLICRYPQVLQYTGIWMEDITHTTKRGSTTFTLSSTNKLLKQYPWATGLKTGSTNKAGYCFCATANKDNIALIAVVMKAPDFKIRFAEARAMLDYGYQNCTMYEDLNQDELGYIAVRNGTLDKAKIQYKTKFAYLDTEGLQGELQKELQIEDYLEAPVEKGQKAGEAIYSIAGTEVGRVDILTTEPVEKASYRDCLKKVFLKYIL